MESIEEKQTFLRTEIIDKGYDPDEFFNYLSGFTKGEIKLEEWSMEDLKKLVLQFQNNKSSSLPDVNNMNNIPSDTQGTNEQNIENNQKQYPNYENNINNEENNNTQNSNSINENIKETKAITQLDKLSNNPFEDFSTFFHCHQFEDSEIIHMNDLRIIVSNPVMKKAGFFSFSYYQYTITTPELNYKVERKLTDFDWLYQKMQEIYPGLIISSVPAKHINMKDNSEKKIIYLNFFMNSMSHYKFIRATPIFQYFLSLSLEDFEKKKKEYEKIHLPSRFQEFYNLEGNIRCIITEERDKKAISIKDDITKKSNAFNKLTQSFDLVLSAFENCKNAMKSLSDSFKILQQIYINQKGFSDKFERLSQISDKWSIGYKEQGDFFLKELRYFFKFMEKELTDSLKVYEDFRLSRNIYLDRFNKMKKNKNSTKDDFLNLDALHKYYGYYLTTYLNEYNNLNKRHEERMNYQFINYCNDSDIFIQDYNTFISLLNFNN